MPSGVLLKRYRENIAWGLYLEEKIHPVINHYLGETFVSSGKVNPLAPMDFHTLDKRREAELKSRKCSSWTFETTYVGWDKVVKCSKNPDVEHWFFFYFNGDKKLFAIKFDWELFKGFERELCERDYGYPPHDCVCIPMDLLTPVDLGVLDS